MKHEFEAIAVPAMFGRRVELLHPTDRTFYILLRKSMGELFLPKNVKKQLKHGFSANRHDKVKITIETIQKGT